MTTDIERQFFDTFGIEPNIRFHCANSQPCAHTGFHCKSCTYHSKDVIYPQITDTHYLKLICILTRWHLGECEPYEIMSINIEQLKNQILSNSLYIAKFYKAKQLVQELFKEN